MLHISKWMTVGLLCFSVIVIPKSSAFLNDNGAHSTEIDRKSDEADLSQDGQLVPLMGGSMIKASTQISEGALAAKFSVTEIGRLGSVQLLLEISNVSDNAIEMYFSSGMDADVVLIKAGGEQIWSWSQDMMFTQALSQTLLKPGGVENYRFEVPASVLLDCRPPCELQARFMGTTSNGMPLLPVMRLPLQ